MPLSGEILPKREEREGHRKNAPETGEISPNQPHEQGDLEAMEEGAVGNTPERRARDVSFFISFFFRFNYPIGYTPDGKQTRVLCCILYLHGKQGPNVFVVTTYHEKDRLSK